MPSLHPSAVLVIKVLPALQAQKELLATMVMMELLENQEKMERTPNYCPLQRLSHASFVQLAHQVLMVLWELKDHPDQKELPASHHAMEFPVTSAWLDNQDQWEDPDVKVHEELPALQEDSSLFPDLKDLPAHQDHPENKDLKVSQVQMVNPLKVHPEKLESQVHPEKREDQDHQVHLAQPETPDRKEDAITAPNPELPQATKQDSRTDERSGFRNFGHGTLTLFCFIFTTGRKPPKNQFFDSMSLFIKAGVAFARPLVLNKNLNKRFS